MATTRIIPMHRNKGKTILQSISARTVYAMNPDKTAQGEHISAYACSPEMADAEFLLSKQEYQMITGREAKQGRDVIAYQIRQAFFPGEVSPEMANKVGYELAMRFTKGAHAFIVATHVDKAHVHNHIIFNSTTLDCAHKFNNMKNSAEMVREISDALCLQYGLSIIDEPAPKGKHYAEWRAERNGTSWKEKLRQKIDELLPGSVSFEHFLQRMEQAGYEIKRGKHIAFRAQGQERFTRGKTLGDGYSQAALIAKLDSLHKGNGARKSAAREDRDIAFLIDIQKKLAEGKGVGYEHWAKMFNLKEMSKALMLFEEHRLTSMAELAERVAAVTADFELEKNQLKQTEARMREAQSLRKHIANYGRTREVYADYRKAKNAAKFYEEHRSDIELHKAAKRAFDAHGLGKKLPTLKQLGAEIEELKAAKAKQYEQYCQAKKEMRDWSAAAHNLQRMLTADEQQKHQGICR